MLPSEHNAVSQAMCSWPLQCASRLPLATLCPWASLDACLLSLLQFFCRDRDFSRHPSGVSQDLFLGLPACFRSLLRLWISLFEKVSVSNHFPLDESLDPTEGSERKSRIISFLFNLRVTVMCVV